MPEPLTPPREVKLFRNNRSQAVRIPVDMELPGSVALIHREGNRLIIEPAPKPDLLQILATLQPLGPDDDFPEIDDQAPEPEDIF